MDKYYILMIRSSNLTPGHIDVVKMWTETEHVKVLLAEGFTVYRTANSQIASVVDGNVVWTDVQEKHLGKL